MEIYLMKIILDSYCQVQKEKKRKYNVLNTVMLLHISNGLIIEHSLI
jgi:hypothetical protein